MAGAGRYELHVVNIDGTVIDQITNDGITPNNQLQSLQPHGSIDPTAIASFGETPAIRFSTMKLATALGAIGESGLDVSSSAEFGYVELSQGGGHESGGEKVAATKCLIVPGSLSAQQDGFCELTYIALPYSSNGTTAPLAHSAALPTGTPAVDELFTLASVTINGTPIGKPIGWNLDFGLSAQTLKHSGAQYPTEALIRGRSPAFNVVAADLGDLSTARLSGSEVDSVVLNLKKMSTIGAGFEGSGDKTITFAKAHMVVTDTSGTHPGDAAVTFGFTARKDGANAIIAIA